MNSEQAQNLALLALGWMAADDEVMGGFLGASGLDPADIRGLAHDPAFMVSVFDYILSADAYVLAFATAQNIAPENVVAARNALPGGAPVHWT
ncbi:DUF3572 domain-containing protein [Abyssibius alkaniclasticus]|uniref:DUF3572 domain-containing protein n=1 Tax=Abyssibius alkaniclasticus TaxID=2881234 RepID=UPI002363A56F|nr:DUF3572 domain-containing protein [Abyssibius alkaniclasticus]UPH70839.1 DUF3572 domain-containing protein [Abyssibius alkaniclasticus]